ncbi:hypothetical protein MAPG_08632 [Magnaporthiopsis poae ATCC 64411]|uniref:Secreted protein n=1 Tax=Magnaporthiopsis poae (strain ATCC 64411 / 73-15) TaxID=644358 RepID=A0A0C4E7V7_MAGP6|nr:hypothetical protein MAPG_08632 [Magnaporthiopsis poae ATCC 64411]
MLLLLFSALAAYQSLGEGQNPLGELGRRWRQEERRVRALLFLLLLRPPSLLLSSHGWQLLGSLVSRWARRKWGCDAACRFRCPSGRIQLVGIILAPLGDGFHCTKPAWNQKPSYLAPSYISGRVARVGIFGLYIGTHLPAVSRADCSVRVAISTWSLFRLRHSDLPYVRFRTKTHRGGPNAERLRFGWSGGRGGGSRKLKTLKETAGKMTAVQRVKSRPT